MSQIKNIVILGGGFAGVGVARGLEKELADARDDQYRIILIEKKNHFYHSIGGLRAAVIDWSDRVIIPYTNLFKNNKHRVIQASAEKLERDHVILDREVDTFGSSVPFAYLVIATGTAYHAPAKSYTDDMEGTRDSLVQFRQQVKSAKSILIAGGGPVGIEFAGEVRDVYKDKKIILLHSQDRLLSGSTSNLKLSQKAHNLLLKNNVQVVLNDRIIAESNSSVYKPENGVVETKLGQRFTGIDMVFLAFGNRPNTYWLKNSDLGASIVSDTGYVKVKSTYQVDHPDIKHVFVLGDAADFDESKHAYRTKNQSVAVIKNVVQMAIHNASPDVEHKKDFDVMFVTFGKKQGVGLLPFFGGWVVGSFIVGMLKSGSLFIEKSWESLNLVPPN
ncbi:hypothetical protein RMATCC62417_00983 [Rhizopus microsporus]|nr:hypothetical protein RMATCC62417_00983 [Rhizopus microsporus]